MLHLVLAERTFQMQCLNKNFLTIADCQLHFLFFSYNVMTSVFSVTTLRTAEVKIFGGCHVYLPKALHSSVTAVTAGNLNADWS